MSILVVIRSTSTTSTMGLFHRLRAYNYGLGREIGVRIVWEGW